MIDEHFEEVSEYAAQAREFLVKGRQYLAAGDLHQASEKGWGAAAHITKAVALAQGWQYSRHSHFHRIMIQARQLTGNARIPDLHGRAENSAYQLLRAQKRFGRGNDWRRSGQNGGTGGGAVPAHRD